MSLRGRRRSAQRGYTVVEVMSAMTIFAIGAAGVMGMQRATIQGGMDARNFDVATNIAREWEHRLQRDALQWTTPDSTTTASNLSNTQWLAPSNIDGTWKVPAPGPNGQIAGYSAAFDVLGHDVAPASEDRMYCVQVRLGWITEPTAPDPTMRAEVRVFWSRLEYGPANCSDTTVNDPGNRNKYQFVNVTTAIRSNPLR